ncbi:MAG: hypothetical protein QME28_02195 [Candidatus Saccharicenans sp.]|nr:hypothetical protein [Candidatus Saccharicenans sp.]
MYATAEENKPGRRCRAGLTIILSVLFLLTGAISIQASSLCQAIERSEEQSVEELKKTAPRVYIDCGYCDLDYIKTEIPFVNYVRERKEADVHVLITTQATGSGGREYTLTFIGQNRFEGQDDLLKYFSHKTDTEEEVRAGLTSVLKIGLMGYVNRTPIREKIKVEYQKERPAVPMAPQVDRWKSWVFSLSTGGYFSGEQSHSSESLRASFSANRVTRDSKFNFSVSASCRHNRYTYEDLAFESSTRSYSGTGLYVWSLGEHWSAGYFFLISRSTYENYRVRINVSPAVEFNLFPYSQSTRRQLRFLYRIGPTFARYFEETLYDRTKETRLSQSLGITLELREKWGSISTSIEGAHFFHDPGKHHLSVFHVISLNLVKGLNANIFGGASLIHDQLSLPKGGASWEEVILRRKMLATSYSYFAAVGFSYNFGSVFTNVVNPRFGSVSSGGMSIIID